MVSIVRDEIIFARGFQKRPKLSKLFLDLQR